VGLSLFRHDFRTYDGKCEDTGSKAALVGAQYRHEVAPKQIGYPAMSAAKVSPFLDRQQSLARANFVSAIEAQSSVTFSVFTTLLTAFPF
jgi:hypothetical protein